MVARLNDLYKLTYHASWMDVTSSSSFRTFTRTCFEAGTGVSIPLTPKTVDNAWTGPDESFTQTGGTRCFLHKTSWSDKILGQRRHHRTLRWYLGWSWRILEMDIRCRRVFHETYVWGGCCNRNRTTHHAKIFNESPRNSNYKSVVGCHHDIAHRTTIFK